MIYLDTSVALAQLLGEGRRPPETLWAESLVSCLASADVLRASGARLEIASYDDRLRVIAEAMGFSLFA